LKVHIVEPAIVQIVTPHVNEMWHSFAKAHLLPAMKRFWWDFEPDFVHAELLAGRMQLWIVPEKAALVTKIDECPNKKVCTVILGGGRHAHQWCRLAADHITLWAQSMGCNEVRIVGRRGWKHYLEDATELGVIFAKRLNHGI
jgi:hypothetical protein